MKRLVTLLTLTLATLVHGISQPIDRKALARRHNIILTHSLAKSPTQVGNGRFAYGMDITGMQTFIPFSTLSDWGWHEFPLPEGVRIEDYKPVQVTSYGKTVSYIDRNPDTPEITDWLRANPHRINLGRMGFILKRSNGETASEDDLSDILQTIDIYSGLVSSTFSLEGQKVSVRTACDPEMDMLEFSIESSLVGTGRLEVFLDLPYADQKQFNPFVGDFESAGKHESSLETSGSGATVTHTLDATTYNVRFHWFTPVSISREGASHRYIIRPEGSGRLSFTCLFEEPGSFSGEYSEIQEGDVSSRSSEAWKNFWESGAAVDLSGSKDPRWFELERRIVLSQYQLRLNECGLFPPQESGLVNNGWFGRFHWEMVWWHMAHYALWNRMDCFSRVRDWYDAFLPGARGRAASEGRIGARWPKCTGNVNREWPCDTHAYLVWQQPHPIWFAEAEYRATGSEETLDRWKEIVLETADYISQNVFWDKDTKRYVIGPPVAPVSENTKPLETLNPIFELAYFRYGLETALLWADRLNLPKSRTREWRKVLKGMSELPCEDGFYKTAESMEDMWGSYNFEHPALTGIFGWLPGNGVDREMFSRTFYKVLDSWQMDKVWGWDYPMLAMAAARLGDTQKAVDLLCAKAHKFDFDEHGLSLAWPFPYFPSNGGVLTAVAMMCGGWDGCVQGSAAPGFPSDGSWSVRAEGFVPMQ